MNEDETKQCLLDLHGISPDVTSILWKRLEEENPEFFKSYFVRLILQNQIKEFNMLLSQQAELMNQLATVDNWQAPRINQNFPSSANGQLMGFSDMASALPHSSIVMPRDGLFSNPSCSVDAFSHMTNMHIVTNNMIPPQSCNNPANGFSDGGLIHQNYGSPDDSLFDFSGNGNIPQLFPLTQHNDFTLPPYTDQINDDGGLYTSMLLGHTPNNTNNDVHIPMNTIDGTVPLRAFGGMRIDDNQLRTWL
ncbi:hypothetical protein QQ045_019764 [Rhodiola kirilowii]